MGATRTLPTQVGLLSHGRRDKASALLCEAPLRCCKSSMNYSMKSNQRVCCPTGSFARFRYIRAAWSERTTVLWPRIYGLNCLRP